MANRQKRVMAVHDISCFGRCSLTVALPILSAAGLECSIIPTAVLSTHTGGLGGFTFRDLTEDIIPIAEHWQTLGLGFDSIYTGYLGSFEQLSLVGKLIEKFGGEDCLVLIDPVMADHGKMYDLFPEGFAQGMAGLCAAADIIVPNMTEAAFLLDEEYNPGPHSEEYIEGLLRRLCALGPKKAVLTGVVRDGELGAASFDAETGKVEYTFRDVVGGYFHGTGDVFGSALLAALMNEKTLAQATEIAVDFTVGSIRRTFEAGADHRFGVNFEAGLAGLGQLTADN